MRRLLTFLICLGLLATAGAQRLIVTDSGSTEREVSRLFVVDSGGTSREIQRLFVVDSGGTARLVYSGALVESVDVTLGNIGGSIGYAASPETGAINPDPFTVNGETVDGILSSSFNGFDFRVNIVGTHPIDHFTEVVVEDGTGSDQTFLTSASTRTTGSGVTTWTWGSGSSAVWESGDVDEVHPVTFTTE